MTLPDGWRTKTIRDLATINYGRDPRAILSDDGEYPVYGTSGSERWGTGYLYDGESIILGRKGTIERVHFASGRFWTIDTAYFLSDFGESVPKWLYYSLCGRDLRALNEATGVPSLSRDVLYKLKTPTPPPPEQAKIAEVLSTVDRAIGQTEAVIAKQQRIRTGLMQDLLTRGIDKHGNLRSEETHEFKNSPLGRIPAEWEPTPFGSCGRWFSGGTPSKAVRRFWGGNVPWICPKDMKQFELRDSIDRLTDQAVSAGTRLMPVGTVFIVIRGMILAHTFPVGISTAQVAFNQDVKAIVPKDGVLGRYLAYWLSSRSHEFLKLATSATHGTKRFDMDELHAVPIGVPLPEEQERIVAIFDKQQALIDWLHGTAEKLRAQKRGLMQDLLTGNRRVTILLESREAVTA
ncbi:MAG: restriction endonuclease subunit S [Phycisphaerales bacterium]